MLIRILTALVGIPLAVFLIFYPGGLPLAFAIGFIAVVGVHELYGLARKTGARPVEWAGVAAVVLFVVSARTYERTQIGAIFPAVLTLLLILSFCWELIRSNRSPILNIGSTVFGAVYVGWLISHLVVLRGIEGAVAVGSYTFEAGAVLVMFTFLCTWASDTGAYFFGKYYGRTKIAPRLSPNKTVEGSVAAVVCSVLVAAVAGVVIDLPAQHALALGAIKNCCRTFFCSSISCFK